MAEYECILLKFLIEKYLKTLVFRHFDFLEQEAVLTMYTKIVPLKTIARLQQAIVHGYLMASILDFWKNIQK
jgi:type III secretory pathway component EscU